MIAYMRPLGHNLVMLMPIDAVDPGWGAGMPGIDPGWGVDTHPHPGHDLPGLPAHPGNRPPHPPTIPNVPDNTLPTTPPPTVGQGMVVIMVRGPDGKWRWTAISAAAVPAPLPEPTPAPKA